MQVIDISSQNVVVTAKFNRLFVVIQLLMGLAFCWQLWLELGCPQFLRAVPFCTLPQKASPK
jgi:hypothetical protein